MARTDPTQMVFWTAIGCTVGTCALLVVLREAIIPAVLASAAFNCWAMVTSDRRGFVRSKELRRAYEPRRHFSPLQTLAMAGLLAAQVGATAYVLIA